MRAKHKKDKITHIIQARVTITKDKHVCWHCGEDANLLMVGYEPVEQAHIDEIATEAKNLKTIDEVLKYVEKSTVSESVYQATITEQTQGRPKEHSHNYHCSTCLSTLLSTVTGKPHLGEVVLLKLQTQPLGAIWSIREIRADKTQILNTHFQDIKSVLILLKHHQDIPRFDIMTIKPDTIE